MNIFPFFKKKMIWLQVLKFSGPVLERITVFQY